MNTDQPAQMPLHADRAVRVTAVLIPLMLALDAAIARWAPPYSTFAGIAGAGILVVEVVCAGCLSAAIARKSSSEHGPLQGVLVFVFLFVFLSILLVYGGMLLSCTFSRTGCEL